MFVLCRYKGFHQMTSITPIKKFDWILFYSSRNTELRYIKLYLIILCLFWFALGLELQFCWCTFVIIFIALQVHIIFFYLLVNANNLLLELKFKHQSLIFISVKSVFNLVCFIALNSKIQVLFYRACSLFCYSFIFLLQHN